MTFNDERWKFEQNWIKDILSRSNTELTQVTSTIENQESVHNMVYYPSLPLIMKTESTNQAHLCSSLLSSSNSGGLPSEIGDSRQQIQVSSNSTTTAAADGADRGSIPFSFQHQYQNTTTANMVIREQPITSITSRLSGAKTMIITNGTIIPEANFLSSSNSSGGGGGSSIKTEPRQPSESATVAYCRAKAGRKMSSTLAAGAIATTATKKPQFKCEQCGMTFGSKSAHTSHTKSHMKLDMMDGGGGGGAGAGGVNNEVIPSNSSMPIGIPKSPIIKSNGGHNAAGGGGDPYECNVCQKTFAVPARLIRHYRTHTGERPFECEFCHKLFSVKENLQVHRRIHTKERPYKCDVCGRAFEHSGKLHRHMRIHTGERPHKCSVCGKTFIQSGQLVIHMRTHTGEKPYKCPVEACGKGFTCSKQLKVHSRTHTGEKPYHCDICFRDFGYNHVLKLHRVQHYGSKCYKCTICEETFKSKKEMEAHIKGHANELPDDDEDDGCTSGGGGSATGGEDDTVTVAVPATAAAVVSSSSSSLSSNEVIAAAADLSLAPPSISSPHASMMLTQVVPQQQQQQQQQLSHKPAKRFNSNKRQQSNNNNNNNKNYSSGSNNALSISSSSSPVARYSPNCCSLSPSPSSLSSSSSSSSSFSSSLNFNNLETDQSRDSGVLSISLRRHNETNSSIDEVPTDLRVMDVVPAAALLHQSTTNATTTTITTPSSSTSTNTLQSTFDYQQEEKHDRQPCYHSSNIYHRYQARRSLSPPELNYHPKPFSPYIMSVDEEEQQHQPTTTTTATRINPVLLEAASIASRCSVQTEEDNKAAISIMQLRNNLLGSQQQQQQQQNQRHYISTREMEQKSSGRHSTIEQTKNDEFTAQSNVQKRYVGVTPVPQYEPMLLNNEIVRQVEAAIAPLRSKSTESPERVSSPESDSIMMLADRDVMTLPLRKRKIYMNENQPKPSTTTTTTVAAAVGGGGEAGLRVVGGNEVVPKVIRMNSVIKFAKAS